MPPGGAGIPPDVVTVVLHPAATRALNAMIRRGFSQLKPVCGECLSAIVRTLSPQRNC
jgi:hypothetical protein